MTNFKYLVFLLLSFLLLSFTQNNKIKLFVIGDSISIFYGPFLKMFTEDKFDYDRKRDKGEAMINLDKPVGANGGDSRMVVEFLKELCLDKTFNADYMLINCGLHDIKTNPKTGEKQIEIKEYKQNLQSIYKLTKKLKVKLIWVNCTPVNDSVHNSKGVAFCRFNKDVLAYNQVSDSIFKSKKVKTIDLYTFSSTFPINAYLDHVHYKPEYVKLQAAFIAGFIQNNK